MIRIEFENLVLELISESDLETVRKWRNAEHVRSNMEYQELISSVDQKKWFDSLDKQKNLYFKIISGNIPIGIINLKEINWASRTAQAGIFIGEKENLSTMLPIMAVYILMRICFECLGIQELSAKIASHNTNAINFNKQLGYVFNENVKEGFDHFICTKEAFYKGNSTIKKLHDLFEKNGQVKISIGVNSEWIIPYISIERNNYILIRS